MLNLALYSTVMWMLHTAGASSCGFQAMSSNWYYLLTTRMTDESLNHESFSKTQTAQKMLRGYPVILIRTHNLQVMKFLDIQIPGSFLRVIKLPLPGSTHRRSKVGWAQPLDHCALERGICALERDRFLFVYFGWSRSKVVLPNKYLTL